MSAASSERLTERLQEGLRDALATVVASVRGVSEEEARQIPEPDEWTVAQLLAHIAEIQGFWMEKAVLITKENDPQITRTAVENDLRIAAVEDHSQAVWRNCWRGCPPPTRRPSPPPQESTLKT